MRVFCTSLGFLFKFLAMVFLCAVELFGIFSPYLKLINFIFLFPIVVMYVFFSAGTSKISFTLLLAGIIFIKLLPITVGGTYIPGNMLLFDGSTMGMVFQIDPDFLLWNIFLSNPKSGFLILVYAVIGFMFAYFGMRVQKR